VTYRLDEALAVLERTPAILRCGKVLAFGAGEAESAAARSTVRLHAIVRPHTPGRSYLYRA
jgi:hypothetical protein